MNRTSPTRPPLPSPIPRACWPRNLPAEFPPQNCATVVAHAEAAAITLNQILDRFHATLAERMGDNRQSYLLAALGELLNHLAPQRSFRTQIPPGKVILEALDGMIRYQGAGLSPPVPGIGFGGAVAGNGRGSGH